MIASPPPVMQKDAAEPLASCVDSNRTPSPLVTILMCTFNGERFLSQQLDSIGRQTHSNWCVLVSDDGSTDATLEILNRYLETWGPQKLTICQGPRRGFAANFLSVTCAVNNKSPFYAWADQDDIWPDHKLERALAKLQGKPERLPLLYSARTELIDESGTTIGFSPIFARPTSFENALVQSIGGGNTMVFNDAAQKLFLTAGPDVDIVAHDWWAYLLVTGAGGMAVHDMMPTILYRQHDANVIGSNSDFGARLVRLRMMFSGRFRGWNERNISALQRSRAVLCPESLRKLELFKSARHASWFTRINCLRRCGVYRQTRWGSLGLILAAIFNKL